MLLLLQEFLGALVRFGLAAAMGWFIHKGIITTEQGDRFTDGFTMAIAAGLIALGWSLVQKYRNRVKFLTALDAQPGTTEAEVQDTIKRGFGSGIGGGAAMLLIVLLGAGVSGCASLGYGVGHKLAQADTAIHDAIGMTVSTRDRLCGLHVLTSATCDAFSQRLAPVIRDAKAFNEAVASNTSASIPTMILSLDQLARDINGLLPSGEDRVAVMAKIDQARAFLYAIRGGK